LARSLGAKLDTKGTATPAVAATPMALVASSQVRRCASTPGWGGSGNAWAVDIVFLTILATGLLVRLRNGRRHATLTSP
jgi:hypothetical protein